ncbi:hypothetical protein BC629DRAFT_749821 [Irpex lacteus]|nr:hypothetical protein BC629DRAFT_749821 [Irpex lacteus]
MAKSKSSKKSKSKSRLTRRRAQSQLATLARPRPRRRSDETDDDEVRERIRRARYPPGVIDSWLSRVKPLDSDPTSRATQGEGEAEVLCTVYLEYKEHPETHKGFDDGGVYTLYLRLATPPPETPAPASPTSDHATLHGNANATPHENANATEQTAQMVLATYDGWDTCMDAPRWTHLHPKSKSTSNSNSKLVFWESREKVAEVLGFVAGEREQALVRQVATMSLR